VKEINLTLSEHEGEAVCICPEREQVPNLKLARFFGQSVDLLELPINPDVKRIWILSCPFQTHMTRIATDLNVKRNPCGKRLAEGFIEVRDRRTGEREDVATTDVVALLLERDRA
jgi:hypothetical protein